MLTNPCPVTPAKATQLWLADLMVTVNAVSATLVPSDGTYLIIGGTSQARTLTAPLQAPAGATPAQVTAAAAAMTVTRPLFDLLRVLVGSVHPVVSFEVRAPDPAQPAVGSVTCTTWMTQVVFSVPDVAALVATDVGFQAVYTALLNWLQTLVV